MQNSGFKIKIPLDGFGNSRECEIEGSTKLIKDPSKMKSGLVNINIAIFTSVQNRESRKMSHTRVKADAAN